MGKKIPLLISTLTLAASSLAPAAVWADEPSKTAWTYDEMAALNIEYEKEVAENCDSGDPMCSDSYIYSKSGDIYNALRHYRERGLTITAVNPYNRTIRVAYDTDFLSRGFTGKLTVKDFYAVQSEVGYYSWGFDTAIEKGDAAALERFKVLFAKNDADPSDVWFPPDTEIELSTPDIAPASSLASAAENYASGPLSPTKYKSIIHVAYRMSNPDSYWGDQFDFSDCAGHLTEGVECQVRYTADKITYVPAEVAKATDPVDPADPTGPTDPTNPADSADSQPGDGSSNTSGDSSVDASVTNADLEGGKGSVTTSDTTAGVATDVVNTAAGAAGVVDATTATTPDTGQATATQEGSTEFPWWLGAIFAAGLGTLVWFFWPKAKKSSKKS